MKEQHDLAKWLEGRMTESERAAFENSEAFATYEKIKNYSAELKTPDFDADLMFEKIIRRPKAKAVVTMKSNRFLRIAAILVISVGLFFSYDWFSKTTIATQNGTTTTFQLPDDSEVILNSGSEITYKKMGWDKKRNLQLDGEAFFKVAKGEIFDVETKLGKVTVVGTQFNVKVRDQRFEVTCFEGKVRVQNTTESVLITRGERITFESDVKINSAAVNTLKPQWLQHEMAFNTEKLSAVIAELERNYDISIQTENINLDKKFTGTIPSNHLELALQIVSSAYALKYSTNKNQVIFSNKE